MIALDAEFERPAATLVAVREVRDDGVAGAPSFTVTVQILAFDADGSAWRDTARLPVVGEDGRFRVCLYPGWTP